jgi:hypothetical protein
MTIHGCRRSLCRMLGLERTSVFEAVDGEDAFV